MGDNLPPGVTPGDIDKHFGAPAREEYIIGGETGFSITVLATDDEAAEENAMELLREVAEKTDGISFHDPEIGFAERQ